MKHDEPNFGADEPLVTEHAGLSELRAHEVTLALRPRGRLRIRGHGVSLRVVPADEPVARLRVWPAELGQRLRIVHSHNGHLSIRVPRWSASEGTALPNLLLELPHRSELQVATTVLSGRFERLTGMTIELEAQTGVVVFKDVQGRLRAHLTHGSLHLRRFRGAIQARLARGAIRASLEDLEPGQHCLEVEVGSIRAELTPDLPVLVDAVSELGSVRSEYASSEPQATATLRAVTKVGSVKVKATSSGSPDQDDGGAKQWGKAPGSGTFRTTQRSSPMLREPPVHSAVEKLSPDEAEVLFEELQASARSGGMQTGTRRRKGEPRRRPL